MSFPDRFGRLMRWRKVSIDVDEATERRIRAWMDRYNHAVVGTAATAEDRLEPDSNTDFDTALDILIEHGLRVDEEQYGLVGSVFGDLMTTEQASEIAKRRREARAERDAKGPPRVGERFVRRDLLAPSEGSTEQRVAYAEGDPRGGQVCLVVGIDDDEAWLVTSAWPVVIDDDGHIAWQAVGAGVTLKQARAEFDRDWERA